MAACKSRWSVIKIIVLHEHKLLKKLPLITSVEQEVETPMYPICLNGNEPMQNSLQGQNPVFPFGSFSANKVHVSSGSNSRERRNELNFPRFYYADQIFLRVWSLFSVQFDFTQSELGLECVCSSCFSECCSTCLESFSQGTRAWLTLQWEYCGSQGLYWLQNSKYRAFADNFVFIELF